MNIRKIILVLTATCCLGTTALADVPHLINFQGTLTDSTGNPINGNRSIQFYLFPDSIGNVPLWNEIHSSVDIDNGLLEVQLGSASPLNPTLFDGSTLWLGIRISPDTEPFPQRQPFITVPYAFRTSNADTADYASSFDIPIHITDSTPGIALVWATNTTQNGYGIRGDNEPTGTIGVLGYDNFGVYGIDDNDNWGYIGGDSIGVFGKHEEGNFGYLGGELCGAFGKDRSTGNYGYLGGQDMSVFGLQEEGNYGFIGGDSVAVFGGTLMSEYYAAYFDGKTKIMGETNIGESGTGFDVNFHSTESNGRLFWNQSKMALRAGRDYDGTNWLPDSIGNQSMALGSETLASGHRSVALGYGNSARGYGATAMGCNTDANGQYSTAMGHGSYAGGDESTAIGFYVDAVADRSIAMGSGFNSVNPLVNNIPNSLMIGFQKTAPTVYVDSGGVGIATTTPLNTLDIAGGVAVGAGYAGFGTAPDDGMIIQGRVGIGTTIPQQELHVDGDIKLGTSSDILFDDDNTKIYQNSDDLRITADDDLYLRPDGDVYIHSDITSNWIRFNTYHQRVGIGTTAPTEELEVNGAIYSTAEGFKFPDGTTQTTAAYNNVLLLPYNGTITSSDNAFSVTNYGSGMAIVGVTTASGTTALYAQAPADGYAAEFKGNVVLTSPTTNDTIMEFGEGLDVAEGFDIATQEKIQPGSVLIIDPDNPGKLTISDKPYDTKVAGIAAGANSLGSGVRLGAGEFDCDVALAGRVYCNVHASNTPIEPGDLLTTSDIPGYAMKANDYTRAQGAILGKAMESLDMGEQGQILVLVTLQ